MAGKKFGIVKAPVKQQDGTTRHVMLGRAMKDTKGQISLILDALPRDMSNWTGWLNIFEDEDNEPF